MNKELRQIIANAKRSTLKYDGYDKLIIQDKDDEYSFCRNHDRLMMEGDKIVGIVKAEWVNGILQARYIKQD